MQIISTCEYERKRGETLLLERGMRFEEVLEELKKVNRFVEEMEEGFSMEQAAEYARSHPVSVTAVEIAAVVTGRLVCQDDR